MVNSVATTCCSAGPNVAALNGQIRRDKQQLDDWTSCVSAKTTKGQAEIQRLSGEISAARDQVLRAQAAQNTQPPFPGADPASAASSLQAGYDAAARLTHTRTPAVDLWA